MSAWSERPTIDVDLLAPIAHRFDHVPPEAVEAAKRLLDDILGEFPPEYQTLADLVQQRTNGRFEREAAALAKRFGVDYRQILMVSVSYDLTIALLGCSTAALATPEGAVLVRNMDWPNERRLAQASYVMRYGARGKPTMSSAGWPGALGVVTGASSKGFAVALNAVASIEGCDPQGYPVLLHLRRVLEDADDFDQALEMLTKQHLAAPGLFTLVGRENRQRVVVERTCQRGVVRWPRGDEPLTATNHYRALLPAGVCPRYERLTELFAQRSPENTPTDAELLYALTDPEVRQEITAQHIVARPAKGSLRLWTPTALME